MTGISTSSNAVQFQMAKGQMDSDLINKTASAIKSAKTNKQVEKTAQAAKDFEAVFISEMLKPMFETIDVDERFGGGKGEEVFRGFMIQEFGKNLAERGGFGIADQVQKELLRIQSGQQNSSQTEGETT